jgi:SAM-dependent methyltransferase
MSPYISDYLRYGWQLFNGFRADGEREIAARRQKDLAPYLDCTVPLSILDLANGRLRPQYMLLKAAGHKVYGIDLVNRPRLSYANLGYAFARTIYAWKLALQTEARKSQTLVCGDVGVLPFRECRFDLVTSVAAFEHFLDVSSVVSELHRVLRPGGLAWVGIHLFTCISGGHNLSFVQIPPRSIPKGIDPWDHLRKRRLPFHVPLNEWRQDQYLQIFARHFEILKHYCATREGEEFLTSEIRAELSAYSRDELTCGSYVIVARKMP